MLDTSQVFLPYVIGVFNNVASSIQHHVHTPVSEEEHAIIYSSRTIATSSSGTSTVLAGWRSIISKSSSPVSDSFTRIASIAVFRASR